LTHKPISDIVAHISSLCNKYKVGDDIVMTNNNNSNHKLVWNERAGCYGIWRAWRKHPKSQQILWARNYGKKAWFIPVDELEPGA
jgi:hypothetical protein